MTNGQSYQDIELGDIADPREPVEIFGEIRNILSMFAPDFDIDAFSMLYNDIVDLYEGHYPGYRSCTTEYHSLSHTLETCLAMVRLMHGYHVSKETLPNHIIMIGLMGALLHDTGYIQSADENEGTGARYTLTHITRSIDFTEKFLSAHGFSEEDFLIIRNMILCTNINNDIENMVFSSPREKTVAIMLGTADLLSQISDRNYLENLTLLYKEFKEGNVQGFSDELDLYRKTVGFFDFVKNRFKNVFGGMDAFMVVHFKHRLNIEKDLYSCAVDKNAQYLKLLFENVRGDIRDHLRRDGIIERSHDADMSTA